MLIAPSTPVSSASSASAPAPDVGALARRFSRTPLASAGGLGAVPGGRGWCRLAATAEYDAWLIVWGTGSCLDLHDHGGSSGALHVVRGALIEQYRDLGDPAGLVTRRLEAGETVVVPAVRTHSIANQGAEVASVHVYSPPLRHLTVEPSTSRMGQANESVPASGHQPNSGD